LNAVTAARDVNVVQQQIVIVAGEDVIGEAVRSAAMPAVRSEIRAEAPISDRTAATDQLESSLDKEVDGYRYLIAEGKQATALKLLRTRLQNLPAAASGRIVFRIKANIGHCLLQLGDEKEGIGWLLEAYDAAPQEPKAVANKAVALIIGGRVQEAYDFCKEALQADQSNEFAAAHLLHAAATLGVDDPLTLVPQGLREREEVILARTAFLRARERRPEWWDMAWRAARSFPKNDRIAFFAAESAIDKATRDPTFQTMRRVDAEHRKLLEDAAQNLHAQWTRILNSEAPKSQHGMAILGDAMLARQVLGEQKAALGLAQELISRSDDENLLLNAAQVAQFWHQHELALQAFAKIGDIPRARFLKGMVHLDRNEWGEAAACFAEAQDVPERERSMVDTVIALAPIRTDRAIPNPSAFDPALKAAARDARCLIIVARVADGVGISDLASKAFGAAVALLGPQSTLPQRSMASAYAAEKRDPTAIIDILDGHVPEDGPSEELMRLAQAHALENPPRSRNLEFFERLPPAVRGLAEFARARASVLLGFGRYADAERIFRSVIKSQPRDVYPLLGLAEALRRQGREGDVGPLVTAVDETAMAGPGEYRMNLAYELRNAGVPDRALKYAYGLVREAPENPKVALGYVFLILGDRGTTIVPGAPAVAEDTWVRIANEVGEGDNFTIDHGASFFGIDVRAPDAPSVKRILGLKKDDTFEVDKGPIAHETWKVVEIKSKYLHLLHAVMEQFEHKFPGSNGMWRFSVKEEGDATEVLDVIRKLSEANRERAKSYTETTLPLDFVARIMGGDAPSFAQYLRGLGARIVTCAGSGEEYDAAAGFAAENRGRGAVLDLFTAWVAAELGILDILKAWFSRLLTPQSTIDAIDALIALTWEGLGRCMMTMGWDGKQFTRHEITDEFIEQQVAALQTIRDAITSHCEVVHVVLPNDLSDLALRIFETFGNRVLDAVYAARSEGMVLLSDDMRYRDVARVVAEIRGLWLQPVLTAASTAGAADRTRVVMACVHLAARRHDHVRLDAAVLRDVYALSDEAKLREFDVITDYIGVEKADMQSHSAVTGQFLWELWASSNGDMKSQRATGMILGKLLRHRPRDWAAWLALVVHFNGREATAYIESWLKGHFLPVEPVVHFYRYWGKRFRLASEARRSGTASVIAMRVAGVIQPGRG
jgi:cellulose synthase operon protein C